MYKPRTILRSRFYRFCICFFQRNSVKDIAAWILGFCSINYITIQYSIFWEKWHNCVVCKKNFRKYWAVSIFLEFFRLNKKFKRIKFKNLKFKMKECGTLDSFYVVGLLRTPYHSTPFLNAK